METYKIEFTRSSYKELGRIHRDYGELIVKKIEKLSENPRPMQSIKLSGNGKANKYRLRIGDYRIIYEIDDKSKLVTIFGIKHRREAYR